MVQVLYRLVLSILVLLALSSEVAANQANDPVANPAQSMVYVFKGNATGNFTAEDGTVTPFTNSAFTLTAMGSPDEVFTASQSCTVPSGTCTVLEAPVTSATLSIMELTAKITSRLAIFDNQTYLSLGVKRYAAGDLLDLQNNHVFAHYGLKESLEIHEPYFKTPQRLWQFNCSTGCVVTSLGVLTVESVQNVTFEAAPRQAEARPQ